MEYFVDHEGKLILHNGNIVPKSVEIKVGLKEAIVKDDGVGTLLDKSNKEVGNIKYISGEIVFDFVKNQTIDIKCVAVGKPEETKRPPNGVIPKNIWIQTRAEELSRAIYEYIKDGRINEQVDNWVNELSELLNQI